MPKVIKRQRTKGWRMPPGVVYVGRPTKRGNPWKATLPTALGVDLYRCWLRGTFYVRGLEIQRSIILRDMEEIRGKDLACWCVAWDPSDGPAPNACHAEVLLEMANDLTLDRESA